VVIILIFFEEVFLFINMFLALAIAYSGDYAQATYFLTWVVVVQLCINNMKLNSKKKEN